eukprot:768038_1
MSSLAAHKEVKYGFNFDEWIVDNGLDSVKQILIQHKATTLATLKFNAVEFQSVLTDTQLLTKVHMLPTLTNAVHNISKIVVHVTDEEQQVIDCIKQNLKAMNETQQEIDTLRVEYPNSFARINASKLDQIKTAKEKVNEMFNEMFMELCEIWKGRREAILSQIESIEDNVHQNVSDSKDVDMISICSENISNCSQLLKEAERTYNTLTSTNEKRSERKAQILKVGQMITYQCTKTQNILKDNIDAIKREIAANNALIIHFDFVVKGNVRNTLSEYVEKLGVIQNKTYKSDQERMNNEDIESKQPDADAINRDHDVSPPPQAIPRSYSSRVSNTESTQQNGTVATNEQFLIPNQSVPALEPNHTDGHAIQTASDTSSESDTCTTDNRILRKQAFLCYECNAKFSDQAEKDSHKANCHRFPVDLDEYIDEHNASDINIDRNHNKNGNKYRYEYKTRATRTATNTKNRPKRKTSIKKKRGKKLRPNSKEWEEERLKAWANADSNPNSANHYYTRYPKKGIRLINGDWSSNEHDLFISRMQECGVTQWGIFSKTISGRIGNSCSAYYKHLIKAGKVKDINYFKSSDNQLRFKWIPQLFIMKKIPNELRQARRWGFQVKNGRNTFTPPKYPMSFKEEKYSAYFTKAYVSFLQEPPNKKRKLM